jgi:hypothetical protein
MVQHILLRLCDDDDVPFSNWKILHLKNVDDFWILLENRAHEIDLLFRWRNTIALIYDEVVYGVTLTPEQERLVDSMGVEK